MIVLVLVLKIMVLSTMLGVEVSVRSPVLFLELTMETAMLSLGHRVLVCCPVLGVEVSVRSPVLGIEVSVFGLMLSIEPLVNSLVLVMSRDNWSHPQQAGERKHGKSSFFRLSPHNKNLLILYQHQVSAKAPHTGGDVAPKWSARPLPYLDVFLFLVAICMPKGKKRN
jgi:hypothetical protein